MVVELMSDELSVLEQVVREHLSELRSEIAATEQYDFRQGLKKKEELLQAILAKLEQPHLITTV
jgi:hypothetical protein